MPRFPPSACPKLQTNKEQAMEIKHRVQLKELAAAGNYSLRKAALQENYSFYTERGYTLEQVKEFSDCLTDEALFRVFDHIQEYKAAPKYNNTPPFWIF